MIAILYSDSIGLIYNISCRYFSCSILITLLFSSGTVRKKSGKLSLFTLLQLLQSSHASKEEFWQKVAFANSFENNVFPIPSCPTKMYACASRLFLIVF